MSIQLILLLVLIVIVLFVFGTWMFNGSALFSKSKGTKIVSPVKGFYLLADGEQDKAMEELKHVALHGGGTAEVYLAMAVIYRKKGELNKAIHINEGLLLRKDLPKEIVVTILQELIIEYRASKDIGKAEECLARVNSYVQTSATLLLQAEIASEKGEHENAIKYYSKYERAANDPCDKEISYEYVNMAIHENDPARRQKALKNALKVYPKNREAYFERALQYFGEGKISQGMTMIETVVRKDIAKSSEDMQRIEDAFFRYANLDELVNIMSERVAAESVNPLPYLFLSKIYKKRGDLQKAKDMLKHYLMTHDPKVIIVRAYAHLIDDAVLLRVAILEDNYKCSECGAKYVEFMEVCTNCGNMDTLEYL